MASNERKHNFRAAAKPKTFFCFFLNAVAHESLTVRGGNSIHILGLGKSKETLVEVRLLILLRHSRTGKKVQVLNFK